MIKGTVGKATLTRARSGKVRTSARGTTIGSIVANGQEPGIPTDPQTFETPGGVAKLEADAFDKSRRGIKVTALKLTLFAGTLGQTVIRLGNAQARISRV